MPSVSSSIDVSRQADTSKMQLDCLEIAGRTVDRFINADHSRPSFLDITGIAAQNSPTCSGLNAGDYKNLSALLNHPNLSQLKVVNKVTMPPEIMEHFAHMQCHCLMGVFPEISRVWLTIDSNIYVWAFEHGSDVAYFDGLGETIVSVGLVKPKSGVFQNFVKYLLVLTTTVEIVVLGVTFTSKSDSHFECEEMHLVPEPVFVLPTDGVAMMSVKATANGRIFMGGKDGCLYEITYQAQLGWFGKHCKKINHSTSALSFLIPSFLNSALYDEDAIVKIEIDNTRNILFTLSEKGSIEVFDLGRDGEGLARVTRLTQAKIVSLATEIVKTLEPNNFKPVISISAVEESESEHLNLVAVTQAGARLYFTTGTRESGQVGPEYRSLYLSLLHVRLPPGFTPNAAVLRPKQVHNAAYENGTTLLVVSAGSEGEALWCVSRVLPGGVFAEAMGQLPLDGPVWAMASLPSAQPMLSDPLTKVKDPWAESRWAVVSGAGAAVVVAEAAPGVLRTLLRDSQGPDSQSVKDFFQLVCAEGACACAVLLACEERDSSLAEWAARAFFLHGSQPAQPQVQPPSMLQVGSPKFSPRQMSTPMITRGPQQKSVQFNQMNQSYAQTPNQSFAQSPYQSVNATQTQFNQSFGSMVQQQRDMAAPIEYSAKHNGLYIYVGRILAPLWNLKCVVKALTPDKKEFMSSKVTGEDCSYVAQKLQKVSVFMQRTVAQPHSDEHASLHALKVFINLAIEMLSLWKVLCEHQFHVVAASLPPEQQSALQAASFRELLVGGQEVACLLLGSLVAGYLRDNASVDGISQKLRQLCPTLYRQEDATCSKANELLIFAKQQSNPVERDEMLQLALKLCKDVAPNVNLPLVCAKLVSVGFFTGVVDLCVCCANKIDPQNKAVHYYNSDQPSQDREGHLAYYRRMEIYREVCSALERLYERSVHDGSEMMPPSPSSRISDVALTMSPGDANLQGRKMVRDSLSREDELLHVAVYEWMISRGLGSELLCLGPSPPSSLRGFLSRAAEGASPLRRVQLLELLWKALQAAGERACAASVLEQLALSEGGGTLAQRQAWLASGVVCVRGGGEAGELLRRLEEAAEVAQLQMQVKRALTNRGLQIPALDERLLEITQLYEEYADRYNLWECKLAIIQCSGHNDPLLVENIWSNILSEADTAAQNMVSVDEKLASILSKVTTLGKEYVNSGHCFPLYFIVRQLEIMSCKLQADHRMVFKAILNIGVTLEQLLDIYIKLVSVKERVWLANGDEIHVCRVCTLILESARDELIASPVSARRRRLARCKDLHETVLCALQEKPNTQRLIERISVAQAHLDRMDS